MSITDSPDAIAPKPKRKRKARKPPRRASFQKPAAPSVEFPGLTIDECAKACNASGCVISGGPCCGHPRKGAQINMNDPAAIERLQKAQKQLAVTDADKRFS